MRKFDELKEAATAAIEREDCDRFIQRDDAQAVLDLFAIQAQLVEQLDAILGMCERQDDFNDDGDGCMFDRARTALAAAGAQP